jgi:hypothetical protein
VLFRILCFGIILSIFLLSNTPAQIMHIHMGEEEHEFNIADVDSINFVDEDPHFTFDLGGPNMSIMISEAILNNESLITGDEIGVFTPGGVCAGASVVPQTFPEEWIGLAAWGTDPGMENGFHSDEELAFRFWDASARREYPAQAQRIEGAELVWVVNAFIEVHLNAIIE